MVAGHFQNDDKGSHRGLHYAGKVARHTQNGCETDAGSKKQPYGAAESRADGQGWCKYAAGDAGHHREKPCNKFLHEIEWRQRQTFYCTTGLIISGAKSRSTRCNADDGDHQTTGACYKYGIPKRCLLNAASYTICQIKCERTECSAECTTNHATADYQNPIHMSCNGYSRQTEIVIVADKAERGETCEDNCGENQAVGSGCIGAPHFFDGDARKRRIEGCRDASCGARQNESTRLFHAADACR